ncbi:hypothetical protein [Chitinophaga sp.]|nr:hypothetical protein [Chitinophaga sp.]
MRTLILLLCTLSCFGQQHFPKVKLLTADRMKDWLQQLTLK